VSSAQTPASSPSDRTDYRVAPQVLARVLAVVLFGTAGLILLATLAIAVFDLHTVFLVVPAVLALALIGGAWWASQARGWLVRMTPEGYRVQWVRGVGTPSARWKDVEDAVATTAAGSPVVVLRLRDGRTTTIPVEMMAVDREQFVRDVQARLEQGHGLRRL
jgi:hypothetical protein